MAVTLADVGLALRRGEVLADDGSLHSTVQAAENAASSFIWLPPETFNESVTIDTAGFVVMGCGRDTLIDGGTTGHAIEIQAANVVVTNLSVQTTGGGGNSFDGIRCATGADQGVIKRVWERDSDVSGISIRNGSDWLVSNCVFERSDVQAVFADTDRVVIVGCVAQSGVTGNGCQLNGDDSVLSYNIVNSSGGSGVLVNGGNDNIITGNRIIGSSDHGISLVGGAADNIIANNRVSGSTNSAIDDNGTNTLLDANNTGS